MDPEAIKKWRPMAYVLLVGSVLSALLAVTGVAQRLHSWIFPSAPYPVLVGYIHLNGQSADSIVSGIVDHDGNVVFVDAEINTSTATFENARIVEECLDLELSEAGGSTTLSFTHGAFVSENSPGESADSEVGYNSVTCGYERFSVETFGPLGMSHGPMFSFTSLKGLFEIEVDYVGSQQIQVHMRQIELPPSDLQTLNSISQEIWEGIEPAV